MIPPHHAAHLWVCSMRYCMGRMSAAPSNFVDALRWGLVHGAIPDDALRTMRRDLLRELRRHECWVGPNYGPLGMACDVAQWEAAMALLDGAHKDKETP